MAKPRMITRTISTTNAIILCLDVETGEPENRSFTFPGLFNKDSEILKAAAKRLAETDPTVHAVHVVNVEIIETLYGMSEAKFMDNAVVIPPRTPKTDEAANETADETTNTIE